MLFLVAVVVSAALSSGMVFLWRALVDQYWYSLMDTPLSGFVWCYQHPMVLVAICCIVGVVLTIQGGRLLKLA